MTIEVKSEADMKLLGRRFGASASGGEVIELVGDVGAGKTTFVKGLAAGLGIDEEVQSPTFTISRVYESNSGLTLVHYDFYRLSDPGVLASELAENQINDRTITVIEWADIVEDVLPADRLIIKIQPAADSEDQRQIEVVAGGEVSRQLLGGLK